MGERGARLNMCTDHKTSAISRCVGVTKDVNRLLKLRVCGPRDGLGLFSLPLFSGHEKDAWD